MFSMWEAFFHPLSTKSLL